MKTNFENLFENENIPIDEEPINSLSQSNMPSMGGLEDLLKNIFGSFQGDIDEDHLDDIFSMAEDLRHGALRKEDLQEMLNNGDISDEDMHEIVALASLPENEWNELFEEEDEEEEDNQNPLSQLDNLGSQLAASLGSDMQMFQLPFNGQGLKGLQDFIENSMKNMMGAIGFGNNGGNNQSPIKHINIPKYPFENGKWSTLTDPENFSQIQCQSSSNLLEEFYKDFKKEEEYPISIFFKCKPCGDQLDINTESKFRVATFTNKYILGSVVPNVAGKCSVYIALFKDPAGEWIAVTPKYGNSYDPETGEIFTLKKNPAFFNQNGEFIYHSIEKVMFGLDVLLTDIKKPLMTPKEFGTIDTIQKSYHSASKYFTIGKITSNESDKAMLFKSGYGISEEKKVFEIALKFDEELDAETLNILSSWLFKVDWNSCELMNNRELFTTDDEILYINADILEGFQYFKEWRNEN